MEEGLTSSIVLEKGFRLLENLAMSMFIRVLFTLAENWKGHNFLEMGDWLNNHNMSME